MMDENKITRDDIYLKARLTAEGVRLMMPQPPDPSSLFDALERELPPTLDLESLGDVLKLGVRSSLVTATNNALGNCLVLDGSGLELLVVPNPSSRLELIGEGDIVRVREDGRDLATGRVTRAGSTWGDHALSNGLPARAVLPGMSENIISVLMSVSCFNYNTGRGCRYCSLFANPVSRRIHATPKGLLREWGRCVAEAVKIALDHGWRGTLAVSGGALPPAERKDYLERMALVLDPIREAVGDGEFSRLRVVYNHYPPEDLADLEQWKALGINGTTIDLEVMDPAYFAAVCPGKHAYKPHAYWKEAQDASVEVFGALPYTTTRLVAGVEPLSCLAEGVEERLEKGVLPIPLMFVPTPGSDYAGFRTPTAEWLVEAADKLAGIYLRHAGGFLRALVNGGGWDCDEFSLSQWNQLCGPNTLVFDEVTRRLM